jgi:lipopolysaccharide transport system permease protein
MLENKKMFVIKPSSKIFSREDLVELWAYRELLYFFVWRDLKVRYKQTFIGVAWAILQPFTNMVIFSVFFGQVAKIPSEGIPYPIFVYVGLLFWQFFSSSLGDVSNSMVANQSVVNKVYFPRLFLPISGVLVHFVDFLISSFVLLFLMIYYQYVPSFFGIIHIPLLLIITFATALGMGLVLSAINVHYRDVRYALPYFIQLLLFLTPVIYPASILGSNAWLFSLNPMSGVISTARATILGISSVSYLSIAGATVMSFLILVIGLILFRRMERYFADII